MFPVLYEDATIVSFHWGELFGRALDKPADQAALRGALEELKRRSTGAELLYPNGEAPLWVQCAAAVAAVPAALILNGRDTMGEHQLICTPFPIDAGGCGYDCGVQIEVHELDQQAVVVVRIDPVRLDYLKFDSLVAPPVAEGLPVFLRGSLPAPVAVSLALSYADQAESVWVPEDLHGGRDVCVFSRRQDELGCAAENHFSTVRRGIYG